MCSLDIGSNGGNIHFKFSFGNVVIGTQLFYFPILGFRVKSSDLF